MKKLLQLLALVFITNSFAQNNSTSFDWAFNGGGGFNTTKRMNYNSQGDLFALIDSGHQTTYGSTTMIETGVSAVSFIAKRTQSGVSTVFLQKNIPNTTYASFQDFCIDNDDNIIITGATFGYNSTVFYDFGNGITLYGKGNFIAKFNPQGVCQWANLINYNVATSSYGENKNIGLGVLPNNDIYFANRSTNGNNPFWLIRYNTNGTEVWHKEWLITSSGTVAIYGSKNNFFFDNTGKAYFYIYSIYGDIVTTNGTILTPPAGAHPSTTSLLTINGDGTNGVFSTYRGAIADLAVEKASGNVLIDWRQYVINPAPFNTLPIAVNGTNQFVGVVALDSNRNFLNRTAALFTTPIGSLFPLGNLNFVTNTVMVPSETISIPNQTFTATKYTPTWKFFENFSFTKFVAHPESNGTSTKSYDLMALYNNKLAVSGNYSLANNPTINVNGTTLTSCVNDPNFATLFPAYASLQSDIFVSQLTISNSLSVSKNSISNFSINPNPATSNLYLSFENTIKKAVVKIISITGQTILEKNDISGLDFDLDVSNLSNGIYLVQVIDGEKIMNSKFIKQ